MKKFKVSIKSSDGPNQEKLKLGLDTIVAIAIRILEQKGKKGTIIK